MKLSVFGFEFVSTDEAFICETPFGELRLRPVSPEAIQGFVWELTYPNNLYKINWYLDLPLILASQPLECMIRLQHRIAQDIAYKRAEWWADNLIDPQAQTIQNVKNMRDYSRVDMGFHFCNHTMNHDLGFEQVSLGDAKNILIKRNLWVTASRVDNGKWERIW